MGGVGGLLLYTLIGFIATAILQSSHATMVLVITALAAGQLTYENALALSIGANVGTTVTAVLGSMTANYQGRRLALAHVIFNVSAATVALVFIIPLKMAVTWFSDLVGIAPDDFALHLAVFHTLFNIIGVLIISPLVGPLITLLERVVRPPNRGEQAALPDRGRRGLPGDAAAAVAKEVEHLFANATELIVHGLNLHRHQLSPPRTWGVRHRRPGDLRRTSTRPTSSGSRCSTGRSSSTSTTGPRGTFRGRSASGSMSCARPPSTWSAQSRRSSGCAATPPPTPGGTAGR